LLIVFLVIVIKKNNTMAEDTKQSIRIDPNRINIQKESELDWWSKQFGVSKEQIKEAVDAVGAYAGAVEYYLKK